VLPEILGFNVITEKKGNQVLIHGGNGDCRFEARCVHGAGKVACIVTERRPCPNAVLAVVTMIAEAEFKPSEITVKRQ
jgi:hypothetical protein